MQEQNIAKGASNAPLVAGMSCSHVFREWMDLIYALSMTPTVSDADVNVVKSGYNPCFR